MSFEIFLITKNTQSTKWSLGLLKILRWIVVFIFLCIIEIGDDEGMS